MTELEKIALLEEIMELEEGSLTGETVLAGLEEWDSLAALQLIYLVSEHFGKELKGTEVREFKTVRDIVDVMVL